MNELARRLAALGLAAGGAVLARVSAAVVDTAERVRPVPSVGDQAEGWLRGLIVWHDEDEWCDEPDCYACWRDFVDADDAVTTPDDFRIVEDDE